MTRPKKVGLDYFPLDVDFDETVQSIELIHQNDGLVWVIKFWQSAYKNQFGEVNLTGLFGELFANKCRITIEKHIKILETALQVTFCYKTETGMYTSSGIQKRISLVSKERSDAIERKNKKENKRKSKVKETHDCSANNWRTSFDVYKKIVDETYQYILSEQAILDELQRLNPGLDIKLSLEKGIVNFWGTEAGWKHKKKSRSADIDMVRTLKANIDRNKVYLQKRAVDKNCSDELLREVEAWGKKEVF